MELLKRYQQDIEEDLRIDDTNIHQVSMRVPSRKHFWIGKLINHKLNLISLEAEKDSTKAAIIKRVNDESKVAVTALYLDKTASETDVIKQLNIRIQQEKTIIEFLEKMEKVFSSLTYDVKNIIEVMKLEQL